MTLSSTHPKRSLRSMMWALPLTALSAGLCLMGSALAQDNYPNKPIRVVVPYTPGGVSDTVTRTLMQKLSEKLKNPIVVDNQPGANGQIGSAAVARSQPDGYTFVVVVAAHSINPSLYTKNSTFKQEELTGVSLFGTIPLLLVSSAKLPADNLKDFVAWGKSAPQPTSFASSGIGSGAHLVGELFAQTAQVPMSHVPYKGIAPALPDLFSGQIAVIFDSMQTMMPHAKAGKIHALAVTSQKRWPSAPDVPTMTELGYPQLTTGSWIGMLAPAKTPKPILEAVSTQMHAVLQLPEVQQKMLEFGIEPVGSTPQEFDAFIRSETTRWAEVIKKANVQVEN